MDRTVIARELLKLAKSLSSGNWQDEKEIARDSILQRGYYSLEDAAKATGNDGLLPGGTEVWYMRPRFFRDGIMGYKWLEKNGIIPDPKSLVTTHVNIGNIAATNPDTIYDMMQGENWSPAGAANGFLRKLGLEHTSMSIGDIIVVRGKTLMVDRSGFTAID